MKLLEFNEYKEKTDQIFNDVKKKLRDLLPEARLEHIGSSAIHGAISKGDLDIFVGVDIKDHESSFHKLKSIGFKEKPDTLRTHELCMLETEKYNFDVAIQLVANGSNFENFIKFRDMLKNDPLLLKEYNQLKKKTFNKGQDAYRKAKSEFISKVLLSKN
jgi:GrpB-like predicted nucleotidyltransferase (UPF0157 family)